MPGHTTPSKEATQSREAVYLTPTHESFGQEAGAEGKKPITPEELEIAKAEAETGGTPQDGWLAQLLSPDHDVSLDDLTDEQREVIANLPEGGTLHLTFENQIMAGVGAADEQERLAQFEGVTSVHNASPDMIRFLMQSGKFENLITNSHASPEGIIITGEDGMPQLLPAEDLAEMAEGSTIQRAVLEGCNSGDVLSDKFAEVGIENVGYNNEVSNRQGQEDAVVLASTGSLNGIETDEDVVERMNENLEGSDRRFANLYQMNSGGSEHHEAVEQPAPAASSAQASATDAAAGVAKAAAAIPAKIRMGGLRLM